MKIKRALIIGITAVALIVTAVIIVKSIKDKVAELGNVNKVLPPSIQYLIES